MIICIPSYKRAGKVLTLDFLGHAFTKDEIIIGTQTEEDYNQYCKEYSERATIIYKKGHSVGDNRNSLLEYCQEHGYNEALLLDDDIRYIITMQKQKLVGNEFRKLMEQCYDMCRKNNVVLFGGYCCENPFMMSRTIKPNIIVGMLFGLLDTSVRFDSSFFVKEDYELSLRLMSKGKGVVRFNMFAASARHKTSGGCEEAWKRDGHQELAELLVQAYPDLIKLHPTRKGEIKFIGK